MWHPGQELQANEQPVQRSCIRSRRPMWSEVAAWEVKAEAKSYREPGFVNHTAWWKQAFLSETQQDQTQAVKGSLLE